MPNPEEFPEVKQVRDAIWALQKRVMNHQDMSAHSALFYLFGYVKAACESAKRNIKGGR